MMSDDEAGFKSPAGEAQDSPEARNDAGRVSDGPIAQRSGSEGVDSVPAVEDQQEHNMTTEDTDDLSSAGAATTDNDLREMVEEIVAEETADLREEVEDLREENAQLKERVEDLEESVDFVKTEIWDLSDAILGGGDEDYSITGAATVTEEEGNILDRLDAVERAVEAGEAESAKAFASEDPRTMLPIEKLGELPDDVAKQQLDNESNRNLYRARHVWNNWDEISHSTGTAEHRGSHLKSADVKRILNTWDEEDAHVESKTVERVFNRLTEWTFWIAEVRHKHGERRLWRPRDWTERREDAREEAELQGHHLADAAVSGGR